MNIMLDLETMGNGPNAAIVAIGAVEFDFKTNFIVRPFYRAVDLESSMRLGGVVDPATVMWWMRQSDDARKALGADAVSLPVALFDFSAFVGHAPDVKVWGNGAAFDNVVLRSAYKHALISEPWHFSGDRCYRTMKALFKSIPMVRTGTHHNALDDARSQALHLMSFPLPDAN